jgi:hypothetical protein
MMESKDQLTIVLKEYDAIRKEVDENTDSLKTRVFPILLALIGGFLAWGGKIPLDVAVLFIPTIIVMTFANVVNSFYLLDRAGRWIASVEDKVFKVSGLPLLTHETELAYQRSQQRAWTWPLRGIIICALYWACEWYLYSNISQGVKNSIANYPAYRYVILSVIVLPSLHYLFYCMEIYRMRKVPFSSSLLDWLINSKFEVTFDPIVEMQVNSVPSEQVKLLNKVPEPAQIKPAARKKQYAQKNTRK